MPRAPFVGRECRCGAHTIEVGCFLQRLFSTFPNSWPGAGLFLFRLCLGSALLYFGISSLSNPPAGISFAERLISGACGIFLLAGLWTPVIGTIVALNEGWLALAPDFPPPQDTWVHLFLAVLSACVAMLGPGAWSIDARLFGRKRFDIDRSKGKRPSP